MSAQPQTGPVAAARTRLSAEARRQAVLDTACRVFFDKSYRGATTAEIAREAGITEPILYRHFGSKRDLYLACLDEAWRQFREFSEEALEKNPAGCLGAIADAYTAKRAKLRLVDLWIQALTEASEDAVIAKALREQIRAVHDFFAEVIRQGQAEGVLNARPRPRRRGLDLRGRRPARDHGPPARRPARRRPRGRAGLAPRLDDRRRLTLSPPGGCSRPRPAAPALSSSLRCRSSRNRSRMRFSSIPPFIDGCRCKTVGDRLTNVNEDALRSPADLLRERRAADAGRRGG